MIPNAEIVRQWTAYGMECAVIVNPFGGCNGYVRLHAGYPRAWNNYDDIHVDVHGGLTYGPDEEGWVGFDTLHGGDWWDGTVRLSESRCSSPDRIESSMEILTAQRGAEWGRRWDEAEVAKECEGLASRLNALVTA